jgi:hypothetical protein
MRAWLDARTCASPFFCDNDVRDSKCRGSAPRKIVGGLEAKRWGKCRKNLFTPAMQCTSTPTPRECAAAMNIEAGCKQVSKMRKAAWSLALTAMYEIPACTSRLSAGLNHSGAA